MFSMALIGDVHEMNDVEYKKVRYELAVGGFWHFERLYMRTIRKNGQKLIAILRHITSELRPELCQFMGDLVGVANLAGMADDESYPGFVHFRDRVRAQLRGIPFEVTPGNHDLGFDTHPHVKGPRGFTPLSLARFEEVFNPAFSFRDVEKFRVVSLNSELLRPADCIPDSLHAARDEHIKRLVSALQPARDRSVILLTHNPEALTVLTEEAKVDPTSHNIAATFVGHVHSELVLTVWKRIYPLVLRAVNAPLFARRYANVQKLQLTRRNVLHAARAAKYMDAFRVVVVPQCGSGFLHLKLVGDNFWYDKVVP
jgi:hypothetical protein